MTSPLRRSSQIVIGCLKRVERAADWLTGAAGPFFVGLCWLLTGFGGVAFFDVILLRQPLVTQLIFLPYALLVCVNMYGHYWWCTRIEPGTPSFEESPASMQGRYWAAPKGRPSSWKGGGGADIGVMDWHRGPAVQRSAESIKGMPVEEEQGHSFGPASSRQDGQPKIRRCRKCSGPKPDRTHHCSVCKKCVFMMDHHCPWINACVGLHNQRHFVLFMCWLSLACWSLAFAGYKAAWLSLDGDDESWVAAVTPSIGFTLIYVLSIAIGVAVPILLAWHLHLISRGETSIEAHDNEYFAKKAKEKNMRYINPYDLGKRQNLELFFNVGPRGQYPMRTLLLPLRVAPASQGWSYPLHPFASRPEGPPDGVIIGDGDGDELTDDEEGGGGWIDPSG